MRQVDTWRLDAACLGLAHDWHNPWFPDGEANNAHAYDEARVICEQCPAWRPCLDAAMAEEAGVGMHHRFGMRGGKTPRQRWRADTARQDGPGRPRKESA